MQQRWQSQIWITNIADAFNFIRMLDADGYPPAFTEIAGLRYEFTEPTWKPDGVYARVRITEVDDGEF